MEIKHLMAALEPFALEADAWEGFSPDENLVEGWPGGPGSEITVAHLREARRIYTVLKDEKARGDPA